MKQTQRTILWAILVMSLFFLYDNWQKHNGKPSLLGGAPQAQSTGAGSQAPGAAVPATGADAGAAAGVPSAPRDAGSLPATTAVPGAAPAAARQGQGVILQNDLMRATISTLGGTISHAEMLGHGTENGSEVGGYVLLDANGAHKYVAQTGVIGVDGAPNHTTPMQVESESGTATAGAPAQVTLVASAGGVRVQRRYELAQGSHQLRLHTTVSNESQGPVSPVVYGQVTRDSSAPAEDSSMYSTYMGPVVYSEASRFQKPAFGDIEKNKAEYQKKASDGWIGMMQHYFASIWLPANGTPRDNFLTRQASGLFSAGVMQAMAPIAPGQSAAHDTELFLGPKVNSLLEKMAPGMPLLRDYGYFTIIARPLFWLLDLLHDIVRNWGWAIVLLTIIVKLAFFPLQAASYRSMAKMRQVTPKMQRIREQFANDRMKQNQAMMELYRTEKINPLGGCLPVVVQIPVFIALYSALLSSVEMRGAPWMGWIQDLSKPDPYFVLPVLMAVTMFIQTKLNPAPPDPMQAKIMLFMPLAFSVMFLFFPSGLVLYWFVSNLFSIVQQWVITRRIEGKPLLGRASAAPPVKKR